MTDSIWNDSKKTLVFYDQGKFDVTLTSSDGNLIRKKTKQPRLTLAPFVVVNLATGGTALVPRDNVNSNEANGFGFTNSTRPDAFLLSAGEFFYDGSMLTIGSHEMGDYEGHPNDWKGVHRFSEII
jgi:hypothetical protein